MNLDVKINNELFRKDQANIIALNRQLAKIQPVRLKYDSNGYSAGQCLGRNTSTGTWEKYSAISGSSPDSLCVLFEDVPGEEFTGTTGTAVARGLYAGDLYQDKLTDLSSGFKTAVGGRTMVNNGDNIFSF